MSGLTNKFKKKYRRFGMKYLSRKPVEIRLEKPIITFTFDDFPITSVTGAAQTLRKHGFPATYYLACGLMGTNSPLGRICGPEEVKEVHEEGHELGCHTYSHVNSWISPARDFSNSLEENQKAVEAILPGYRFRSHAYPFGNCTPETKAICGKRFKSARGGDQIYNAGIADLNNVRAYFLDRRLGETPADVNRIIEATCENKGWLVFSTHDLCDDPSPFGNTESFFREVVAHVRASGARVLTVDDALKEIG